MPKYLVVFRISSVLPSGNDSSYKIGAFVSSVEQVTRFISQHLKDRADSELSSVVKLTVAQAELAKHYDEAIKRANESPEGLSNFELSKLKVLRNKRVNELFKKLAKKFKIRATCDIWLDGLHIAGHGGCSASQS